jgi:autotransporter adhesin
VGQSAQATASNSVALGSGSVANQANTVSVGTSSSQRRITNVAAGTAATDAVNKSQLDAVAAQAGQTDASAVKYDGADKRAVTFAGPTGTTLHNVAAGTAATDAVNKGQLDAVSSRVDANTTAIGVLDGRVTGIEDQIGGLQQDTAKLSAIGVDTTSDASDQASVATGSRGVAIGASAKSGGDHATAVGGDSEAAGANDTALGGHARVDADGSTAVGANTHITADATNAVAVGESATVSAASGTALGQGASASAQGAVALGQGAVADQADTVSVGNAGTQRRIVNVAAGTAAHDAVNVDQLDEVTQQALETAKSYADNGDVATLQQSRAYTDSKFANTVGRSEFDTFRNQVDDRFHDVDRRLDRVGAMGTAMAQMSMNTAGLAGDNRMGVGAGRYGGQSAIAVGYQHAFRDNRASFSVGASASGSESSVGIGGGFSW